MSVDDIINNKTATNTKPKSLETEKNANKCNPERLTLRGNPQTGYILQGYGVSKMSDFTNHNLNFQNYSNE